MKKMIFILLLVGLICFLFPRRVGVLSEVLKPDNISIFQDELYVAEGSVFYIYSIKDLQLKKKFGSKGEGPGEILSVPNFPTRIHGFPDYILVEGINKILFFNRNGRFIREIRKPAGTAQMLPLGKNYVAKRVVPTDDNRTVHEGLYLYNSDMKQLKLLYSQKWVQQGAPPNLKLDLISDFINFRVYDNKLFVEESPEGFCIKVFDEKGNELYEIKKPFDAIKVEAGHREQLIKDFQDDPWVKPQIRALGGWEEVKKIVQIQFLDYFPAIKNLDISGGKLIIQTFRESQGKEEYIVMDFKGNIEKKLFVPPKVKVHLMPQIFGVKLSAVQDGKLFFVQENEDEEWELQVLDLF